MKSRQRDELFLILTIAAVVVLRTQVAVAVPVPRAVVAIPFVLLLPGYMITAAFFPRRELAAAERLLFTVSLSLVLVTLSGLLLGASPWGLQPDKWTGILSGLMLLGAIAALVRGHDDFSIAAVPAAIKLTLRQGLLMGLAAMIVFVALRVARTPATQHGLEGYTMFWLLPAGPTKPDEARLGITNMEFTSVKYRLDFEMTGHSLYERPFLELEPGETWQSLIVLPASYKAGPIIASLYRLDDPLHPYRQVIWWPKGST